MENRELAGNLEDYLTVTHDAERKIGGRFWDRVDGRDMHNQKRNPGKMWDYLK